MHLRNNSVRAKKNFLNCIIFVQAFLICFEIYGVVIILLSSQAAAAGDKLSCPAGVPWVKVRLFHSTPTSTSRAEGLKVNQVQDL